VTGTDA